MNGGLTILTCWELVDFIPIAPHLGPLVESVVNEGFFTADFARTILKESACYDARWEELFRFLDDLDNLTKAQVEMEAAEEAHAMGGTVV